MDFLRSLLDTSGLYDTHALSCLRIERFYFYLLVNLFFPS